MSDDRCGCGNEATTLCAICERGRCESCADEHESSGCGGVRPAAGPDPRDAVVIRLRAEVARLRDKLAAETSAREGAEAERDHYREGLTRAKAAAYSREVEMAEASARLRFLLAEAVETWERDMRDGVPLMDIAALLLRMRRAADGDAAPGTKDKP